MKTLILTLLSSPALAHGQGLIELVRARTDPSDVPPAQGVPVASTDRATGTWGDADVLRELRAGGQLGVVHGSAGAERTWVLAVTNPTDMFDHRFYPLRPANGTVAAALAALGLERHDQVRVRGRLASDPPHIVVSSIAVVRRDPVDFSNQARELRLPLDLQGRPRFEITALVHAVLREGRQVAVEYRNHILPLTLDDPEDEQARAALARLWRNDIIRVRVQVRGSPSRPTHLMLDGANAVTVLERVRDMHGQPRTFEGPLVLFARAPGLRRDVWAIAVSSPSAGVTRYITLNNFSDPEKWARMDARLRREWDARRAGIEQGRNKFINPGLIVRARGTTVDLTGAGQELARNQANQTLEVAEPDHLEVVPQRPDS